MSQLTRASLHVPKPPAWAHDYVDIPTDTHSRIGLHTDPLAEEGNQGTKLKTIETGTPTPSNQSSQSSLETVEDADSTITSMPAKTEKYNKVSE